MLTQCMHTDTAHLYTGLYTPTPMPLVSQVILGKQSCKGRGSSKRWGGLKEGLLVDPSRLEQDQSVNSHFPSVQDWGHH